MAKKLMIQGTMSNAGKSLLTAGLLRVMKQDGYRVAPFKSQNMALNSYITEEGLEMGRAQVMQAEAAGIRPEVEMNPILLKPTSDIGSQVIVNGEVLSNMPAREYFAYKKKLIPDIRKAYDKLDDAYDIIVIEGAGSPAEINLKAEDIVNMGLAKLLDAPVLLVGDIDRGGVFAQLYGTVALLEEEEKERIKGFIINKFRGDKSILDPGLTMLYEKCHIPFAGVIPYVHLDIDDEDSLSERFGGNDKTGQIDIVVIKFPHISNFTDFAPLERAEGISLRYISSVADLKDPDLVLLPGTKNTIGDLMWMRENGLEAGVKKLAAADTPVMGICGGYQMLGSHLEDPDGLEQKGTVHGMGLLPLHTIFRQDKKTEQVRGNIKNITGIWKALEGVPYKGYEIHMGYTTMVERAAEEAVPAVPLQPFGSFFCEGKGFAMNHVMGTYIHGIFDEMEFLQTFLEMLFQRKGLHFQKDSVMNLAAYKNIQYNKLADTIREHMDMDLVYQILR